MEQLLNDAVQFSHFLTNFLQRTTTGIQRIIAPVLAVPGHPNIPLHQYPDNVINHFNRQAEPMMVGMTEMEDAVNEVIHQLVHTFLPGVNQMPPHIHNAVIQVMGRLVELRDQLTNLEEFFLDYRHYFEDPDETFNMTFADFI